MSTSEKNQVDDLTRLKAEYYQRDHAASLLDKYSVFDKTHQFTIQQRQRAIIQELRAHGVSNISDKRILDLGCGRGNNLLEFLTYGALPVSSHGCDIIFERVAEAKSKNPFLPLSCTDGQYLPYPIHSFDIVLQFTVFSSILDAKIKQNIAQEIVRVLKPGGCLIWYDFWTNPTNPQTKGIPPGEIRALFPGCSIRLRRITLAPPITRLLVNTSWIFCLLLEKTKIFNSHYLGIICPKKT